MIKKPKNWENVQAAKERAVLPAGGYVVKIIAAKVASYPSSDGSCFEKLEIALDIDDGDYKGFYDAEYKAQTQEERKWKGVLRQYLPTDDGSDRDEWTKSSLKALTDAVEDSNSGYRWDWDETKLKGKVVGCLFRLEEWAVDGKKGWKAQPFKFIPVEDVRKGKFKMPKFKAHRDYPDDTPDSYESSSKKEEGGFGGFQPIEADEGDLPF